MGFLMAEGIESGIAMYIGVDAKTSDCSSSVSGVISVAHDSKSENKSSLRYFVHLKHTDRIP